MCLVFDNRENTKEQGGMHALIVGISDYIYLPEPQAEEGEISNPKLFGLRKLSSSATSAYKVFCWLRDHQELLPVPLATVRLLLSPSEDEIKNDPNVNIGGKANPSLTNFTNSVLEWQFDAARNKNNRTFFYFAGHGFQYTKDDSVLLLEDFGTDPRRPFYCAVSFQNIYQGLIISDEFPEMAQTQFYFIDSCRENLRYFPNHEDVVISKVFDIPSSKPRISDARSAPIFFATISGAKAYAQISEQTFFSKILLDCLNNDAGDYEDINGTDTWLVSISSLTRAITKIIQDTRVNQQFSLEGNSSDTVICFQKKPPTVSIALSIEPKDALSITKVQVFNNGVAKDLPSPLNPHPYVSSLSAGPYSIVVNINPHNHPLYKRVERNKFFRPPLLKCKPLQVLLRVYREQTKF